MSLEKLSDNEAILKFDALAYPYRGVSPIIDFLNAFQCKVYEIDEGGYVGDVIWINKFESKIEERNKLASSDKVTETQVMKNVKDSSIPNFDIGLPHQKIF